MAYWCKNKANLLEYLHTIESKSLFLNVEKVLSTGVKTCSLLKELGLVSKISNIIPLGGFEMKWYQCYILGHWCSYHCRSQIITDEFIFFRLKEVMLFCEHWRPVNLFLKCRTTSCLCVIRYEFWNFHFSSGILGPYLEEVILVLITLLVDVHWDFILLRNGIMQHVKKDVFRYFQLFPFRIFYRTVFIMAVYCFFFQL